MFTNIKSEYNAPFLKSPFGALNHFIKKSLRLCQISFHIENIHVIQLSTLNMNDGCHYN